jgi:hypothetical protein
MGEVSNPNEAPVAVPLRVLFLGNSYTSVNDLPGMLAKLVQAQAEARRFVAVVDCPAGQTLQQHWSAGRARNAIQRGVWDWVVLQDQSQWPSFPLDYLESQMYPSVRLLNECIRVQEARTLFYLTWGRQNGDRQNLPMDSFGEMQARLTRGYETIARELDAAVAPVGLAWERALERQPGLALFDTDGSHPTVAGTYLAACVFYEIFYGRPAIGAPFTAGLDAKTADFIQAVAAEVVGSYALVGAH